jgi:hypothetical protein
MNLASRHAFYQTAQEQVIHEAFTGDLYYLNILNKNNSLTDTPIPPSPVVITFSNQFPLISKLLTGIIISIVIKYTKVIFTIIKTATLNLKMALLCCNHAFIFVIKKPPISFLSK